MASRPHPRRRPPYMAALRTKMDVISLGVGRDDPARRSQGSRPAPKNGGGPRSSRPTNGNGPGPNGRGKPLPYKKKSGVVLNLRGTPPQNSRATRGARQGTEQSTSSNHKVAVRPDSRVEPRRPNTQFNRASALFLSTGRDALLFGAAKRREGRRRPPVPPGQEEEPR